MRAIAVALVAGAASVQFLPQLPDRPGLLLVPPILGGLWLACRGWPGTRAATAFLAGLLLATWAAEQRLEPRLEPRLAGEDLRLVGRIDSLPEQGRRRDRFRFAVEEARFGGEPVQLPGTLRLSWYGPDRPALAAGDRWRLTVRLRQPRGFRNPGGFDYAGWLFRTGIGATGYVRADPPAERLAPVRASVDRLRGALRDRLEPGVAPLEHTGILLALAIGDRERIGPDAWDVLLATGTNHLVAISGLHIGLVAGAAFLLAAPAWRLLGRHRQRVPRPLFQAGIAIALATVYAALAGFALPTQRALIMLSAALGALLLRRRNRPASALAFAAIAVVLFDPLAPLSASFWLSFGAVAAIVYVLSGRVGRPRRLEGWVRVQLAISLALAPLLVAGFGRTSLIAPLANLVAVPWVSFGVVPPTLLATALAPAWPEAAGLVLACADRVFHALWLGLDRLAALPLAQWHRGAVPAWCLVLAGAGIVALLAPRGVPGRAAGAVALLPLLLWTPPRPVEGAIWLDVLDVGQGLAVVVRTRSHTLVYDTGPRFSARFDAGAAAVVPFLRAQGIARLDALVVSHGDNDHAGGADSIRRRFPPGRIHTSAPDALAPAGASAAVRGGGHAAVEPCDAGTGWSWDGVTFRFLHPGPGDQLSGNDGSCVLHVRGPAGSVLLPGDIERAGEGRLLERVQADPGLDVRADVVVAPHHGSATSSTPALVRAVDPEWVIYSVGYRNRWQFPDPAVMARWRPAGFARTDCGGALHLRLVPGAGVGRPAAYRVEHRRPWHRGCDGTAKSGTMRAVSRHPAAPDSGG